ncbi:MAG: dTDP-4-dehydrorhamnose reductase [Candidatus Thorarchaeota archaeon]
MKILITGANGQLGQDFQKLFSEKKIDFVDTDITGASHNLDITKLNDLRAFVKKKSIDCVINCAAYNAVDKAEKDWYSAYLINGIGTRNLALVSKEIKAIFVHYSTDAVFDGTKGAPYTIFDRPNPISKYGESKLLGEFYTQQLVNDYFLIRISWLFGLGNVNFVKKVLEWSKGEDQLRIVDDQVSAPTYCVDLAKATYSLILTRAFGLYHITNAGFCSRFEWANHILRQTKWKGELVRAKTSEFDLPARRPSFSVLDNFGTKETIKYSLPDWKNATDRFLSEMDFI